MDETGRVGRKYFSSKPLRVKNALYDGHGNITYSSGEVEPSNIEMAASILESIAAAFGRSITIRIFQKELILQDEEGEFGKLSPEHALSMIEDMRLSLSCLLDRKI